MKANLYKFLLCGVFALTLGNFVSSPVSAASKTPLRTVEIGGRYRCEIYSGQANKLKLLKRSRVLIFSKVINEIQAQLRTLNKKKARTTKIKTQIAALKTNYSDVRSCKRGTLKARTNPATAPTATPTPAVTNPPPLLEASSVTQWGITWHFDRSYRIGKFANGDYWVAPRQPGGVVNITRIEPDAANGKSGWDVNPAGWNQPYDSCQGKSGCDYDNALMPVLPFQARAGMSIVKAASLPIPKCYLSITTEPDTLRECNGNDSQQGGPNNFLRTAAVLTVLDQPPVNEGRDLFRPPYFGASKPLYRADTLRTAMIPSVPLPATIETFAGSIATSSQLLNARLSVRIAKLQHLQLDHLRYQDGMLHPIENLHYYGAGIASERTDVALRIITGTEPLAEKLPMIYSVVQAGIDIAAMLEARRGWVMAGGHGHGRLMPVAFAALLLNDEPMKQLIRNAPSTAFGETDAVWKHPTTGRTLFGVPGAWINYGPNGPFTTTQQAIEFLYWFAFGSHRFDFLADPYGYIDGGENPGGDAGVYQTCCSSGNWKGTAMILNLLPNSGDILGTVKANFFEYMERWFDHGTLTQPDVCAPARGFCSNNSAISCTTANEVSRCGSTPQNHQQNWCRPDGQGYCYKGGSDPLDLTRPCTLANQRQTCGTSSDNFCMLTSITGYGQTFGPDGNGSCIRDTDNSDGIGRFPHMDGSARGGGSHSAWLSTAVQNALGLN